MFADITSLQRPHAASITCRIRLHLSIDLKSDDDANCRTCLLPLASCIALSNEALRTTSITEVYLRSWYSAAFFKWEHGQFPKLNVFRFARSSLLVFFFVAPPKTLYLAAAGAVLVVCALLAFVRVFPCFQSFSAGKHVPVKTTKPEISSGRVTRCIYSSTTMPYHD